MILDISIWAAFLAGLLSFLSPCVLPLVPPYLCFITGRTLEELTEPGEAQGERNCAAVLAAVFFVLGFSTVFVSLGVSASAIGQILRQHLDLLGKIAGAAIILMGLHFVGLFRLAVLDRDTRFQRRSRPSGLVGAYGMGLAFAFGWTPCIGPVLATILAVAASKESIGQGGLLLSIYSAGLGVPFVLAAFGVGNFVSSSETLSRTAAPGGTNHGRAAYHHRRHVPHRNHTDRFVLAARGVSRTCSSRIVAMQNTKDIASARQLSPLRHSTAANGIDALVEEQLRHFSIDPHGSYGEALTRLTCSLYQANVAANDLWRATFETIAGLDRRDRVAYFNAKRFACFQLAKILDTLQNPLRKTYQSLAGKGGPEAARGPYPLFDNVTAIFSATPVVARTATYLYACVEWVEDAFKGKELLHAIYSRLLNPTSVSLANHIVDVEAGPRAAEYFAWNFNSGMAAIDATLAHLLGYRDIVLASRNVYGGSYQLLHDWYGKRSNLNIAVAWFEGHGVADFEAALAEARQANRERLDAGRNIYVFLESPCNPHGYVLDVPGICRSAHRAGSTVICDATIGTPFLHPVLRRDDPMERPDFVIHSYTKDLAGYGATTAGVCIGRNERMFLPKGERVKSNGPDGRPLEISWDQTLFWNVYYVKGAFLDADKAYEVINGMRTLELRMLSKCIGTMVLAKVLAAHPMINVNSSAAPGNANAAICEEHMFLGLPAPLFTIDFEPKSPGSARLDRAAFKKFFDCLEPVFGLQVSLGQVNTVVLCPALTSHSELDEAALREAGIAPTTIRIAVGNEDPRSLIAHIVRASELALDAALPGFSKSFLPLEEIDRLYQSIYTDVHQRYVKSRTGMTELMR